MKKKTNNTSLTFLMPTFFLCILLFFFAALSNLDRDKAAEDKQQLENALARAAVSCYAIEGAYPPTLSYLIENYGVQIDTARYIVKYELFASNFMPDITVVEQKP